MPEPIIIRDSLGRSLEVKKLTVADQFDLLEAAQNRAAYEQWFGLAALVFSCTAIDGVPLPMPRKPADFKKNADNLKDEGVASIATWLGMGVDEDKPADTTVDTAKN